MRSSRDELQGWDDAPRRPVRVSTARWGRDLVVGWAAPWGPSIARVARGQSAEDAESLVLGRAGAGDEGPQLVALGERLACAWIDADGAAVARLAPRLERVGLSVEGRTRGRDVLATEARHALGAEVRSIAMTPSADGRAWIAAAGPHGVTVGRLRADAAPELDAAPWIRRDGAPARVAIAEVGGEPLVLASYESDRELVVARREGARVATVTHRLAQPMADLAASGSGARVALALVEASRQRVWVTTVDARGRLVEQPHVLVDRWVGDHELGRVGGAAVVWVDDAFRLVVQDETTRAAHVVPFVGGAPGRAIGRVVGPPSARFVAPRVELVSVEADDEDGLLSLVRARADGGEATPLEVRLAPPDDVARERGSARAALLCTEVARDIAGTSYRGSEIVVEPLPGGARVALERSRQTLSVRFVSDRRFLVRLETRGEGAEPLEAEPGSLLRLGAWVRQRLSASARSAAAREAAWARACATQLAGAIPVHDAQVRAASDTGAVLEAVLAALPRPDVVARWTELVREDLAGGRHRSREEGP